MTLEEVKTLKPGDKVLLDGEIWKFRHIGTLNTAIKIKLTRGNNTIYVFRPNEISFIKS